MAVGQTAIPQAVADSNPGIAYLTALASIKLVRETSVLDLTEDDFNFLTGTRLWLPVDRSRGRRCVEAAVYGALDFIGFPRFPAPVEYIAAVIATYVSPVNIQIACAVMDGAEFSENIINGVERSVSSSELFAHVLRILAGIDREVVAQQAADTKSLRGTNGK